MCPTICNESDYKLRLNDYIVQLRWMIFFEWEWESKITIGMKFELRLIFAYTMTRLFDALNVSCRVDFGFYVYLPFVVGMCQTFVRSRFSRNKWTLCEDCLCWKKIVFQQHFPNIFYFRVYLMKLSENNLHRIGNRLPHISNIRTILIHRNLRCIQAPRTMYV